jgi:DnaJ-class molecular chaperone
MTTHYDVFEIEADAPIEVIHAVYRALSENIQSNEAKNLDIAYAVLSDPIKRKAYDESLVTAEAVLNSNLDVSRPTNKNKVRPSLVIVFLIVAVAYVYSILINNHII